MPEVPSKIYFVIEWVKEGAYLDDCALSSDFKDLTLPEGAVSESDIDDLSVSMVVS